MVTPLPALLCPRTEDAAPPLADPVAASWGGVERVQLSDVVTGARPEQQTQVRIVWSPEALRVLFQVEDTHSWATITQRDGPLWEEEVVEIFIDPVGDAESYYEIEVNPLGTVVDLVCRRNRSGYKKDFAWDCEGLATTVRTTANGWAAELVIPFSSIVPTPPRAGDIWRVNFCRIDRPTGKERELTAWSPTGLKLFHVPERFGQVEFR